MVSHLDNERELVQSARAGDADAFMTLAGHYERNIFRLAMGIVGNPEDAEDVTQESFLKALANLGGFHGDSRFYTWLVRIAMNEALMKLRRRKTEKSVSLDAPEPSVQSEMPREIAAWDPNPEQRFAHAELRAILDEALSKLPHGYRVVVMLRDVEQLTTEETAEILNMGIPAVKSRLLRGRLMLRESLNKHFKRGLSYQLRKTGAMALPRKAANLGRRMQRAEEALGGLLHLAQSVSA